MNGLFIIWLGQMISGIATSMAFYALPFWISNKAGASGSALAYWETFFFAAYLFFVLFALFFIDRFPRKPMMLMYDFLLFSATLVLWVLETAGRLEIWHLYLNAVIQGVGYAFRLPTYSAVITILVPRKQNVRANGMLSLLYDLPEIFGPLLAAVLFLTLGLQGILAINLLTFLLSIGTLLLVEIPSTPYSEEGIVSHIGLLQEATYGIKYILKHPGLLGVQMIFLLGNIFSGIALSVTALYTMINLRTGGNGELALSVVQSSGAWAAVLVGLAISLLGGLKHPIRAILWGWIISSLFGLTLLGIGQMLIAWVVASVINAIFGPIVDVAINNFIQTKVPPDIQGRVFSASEFLAQIPFLFTPLLAAYFGDQVFEPAMQAGGPLANTFAWLVGTGPGAGYGLMILLCGVGGALVGLWGFLSPTIRNANENMPDVLLPPPVGLLRKTLPLGEPPPVAEEEFITGIVTFRKKQK